MCVRLRSHNDFMVDRHGKFDFWCITRDMHKFTASQVKIRSKTKHPLSDCFRKKFLILI
jgi:hypothetical protein